MNSVLLAFNDQLAHSMASLVLLSGKYNDLMVLSVHITEKSYFVQCLALAITNTNIILLACYLVIWPRYAYLLKIVLCDSPLPIYRK
jgi:hypothetical protein